MAKLGKSFCKKIYLKVKLLNGTILSEANYPVYDHKDDDESWIDFVGHEDGASQFLLIDIF